MVIHQFRVTFAIDRSKYLKEENDLGCESFSFESVWLYAFAKTNKTKRFLNNIHANKTMPSALVNWLSPKNDRYLVGKVTIPEQVTLYWSNGTVPGAHWMIIWIFIVQI